MWWLVWCVGSAWRVWDLCEESGLCGVACVGSGVWEWGMGWGGVWCDVLCDSGVMSWLVWVALG